MSWLPVSSCVLPRATRLAPSRLIFDGGRLRSELGVAYGGYDMAVAKYNQTLVTALKGISDTSEFEKDLHHGKPKRHTTPSSQTPQPRASVIQAM